MSIDKPTMKTAVRGDERILQSDIFSRDAKPPRPQLGTVHDTERVVNRLVRRGCGVVLHLHAEQAESPIRKLGIPFSAVKALFFVREFDARGEEAGTASDAYLARRTMAPLLDVLEEMDMLTRLHRDGLLSDHEYASKRTMVLERL